MPSALKASNAFRTISTFSRDIVYSVSSSGLRRGAHRDAILCEVMSQVIVYTTDPCSFCARVKGLLKARGVEFAEINLSKDPDGRVELARTTGMMSFPQVIVDGELIGGFTEVQAAAESGRLDELVVGRLSAARRARPRLAGLAHVRSAPADDHLHDRRAAHHARLALAQVHEELVLEGAAHAVDVAEVVDARAARVDAGAAAPRSRRRAGARTARA